MWIPNSVTFGIRHQNVFGFLGRAGDIIDAVREAEGGRVIPNALFRKVQWPNQVTARMLNDDESVTVDFSIEGIILTADLEETDWGRERVRDLFLELVGLALPISRGGAAINRLGIIDNYALDHEAPGEMAVNSLTALRGIGEPSDFTLRAAFRNPTERGLVHGHGHVDDWRNTILQVGAQKKTKDSERPDTLRVSIDHQVYYAPERRFTPGLIEDHYRGFLEHVERLQRGPLAGLMPQDRAVHDR